MSINHCKEFRKLLTRSQPHARPVPRAGCGAYTPLWVHDGNVTIEVHDKRTGRVVERQRKRNKIVTTGLWAVRDLLVDVGLAPKFFAVGTDGTATEDGTNALLSEVFRTTITRRERMGTKAVFQAHVTEADAVGNTLQEAGLFVNTGWAAGDVTEGGALFARTVFTPITKTAAVWVTFTWEIPLATGTG